MLETGLSGRVALVTGAANGIGRATAELLAAEDSRLALCDDDADALQALDLGVPETPLRIVADLSQRSEVERALAAVNDRFGRLDVLVHCAGIYRIAPLPEVTDEEWERVIDVNLRSSFLLAQGAVEAMREHGDGRIVLFGSYAARTGGLRAGAPYAASKAGVEGLTRHLAAYAGPLGVRVNCIHPGFILTQMTAMLGDDARAQWESTVPLRRAAEPPEVASMAVVLASDLAGYVHGVTLDVNGGMFMA
jgi:NAD(P)-dependent dehydrogenase (short-subunit alcohol dehydrogenase family)